MELKNEHGKLCIDPSGFRENRKDISKRLIWACRANFALSKVNILWSNLIFYECLFLRSAQHSFQNSSFFLNVVQNSNEITTNLVRSLQAPFDVKFCVQGRLSRQ
jgi:hypothetical protein